MSSCPGRRRTGGEAGFVAHFTAGIMLGLLMLVGIVLDSGRAFRERSEAFGVAAAAARVGAQRIDEGHATITGDAQLDVGEAQSAAMAYVQSHGLQGTAVVTDTDITVTVSGQVELAILFGQPISFSAEATATAVQVEGGGP